MSNNQQTESDKLHPVTVVVLTAGAIAVATGATLGATHEPEELLQMAKDTAHTVVSTVNEQVQSQVKTYCDRVNH